jgi:hypothetical protein
MDAIQTQPQGSTTPLQTSRTKFVYTIVERKDKKGGERKYWVRVGSAYVNQDGSLNVWLDASPTNGMLHIRDADFSGYGGRREPPREALEMAGGVA